MSTEPKESLDSVDVADEDTTRPDDGADAWETPKGIVVVTAPAGVSPYYRLFWGSPRRQTSGGRTFESAWVKALKLEAEYIAGATEKTVVPVSEAIEYWLSPTRRKPRGNWGPSHTKTMTAYAARYFTPTFGAIRCMDLKKAHVQAAVNKAPTASEGANVRRAARSLIGAMRQGDYLMENQVLDISQVWWHGEQPDDAIHDAEEQVEFIPVWERPSNDQVRALRVAAETVGRGKWWRGLMVELAAYSGVRWSELVALTADCVDPNERTIAVRWKVEYESGKGRTLAPPKMRKRRTTIFPEVSPTGYKLEKMLRKRVKEAQKEQEAGWNPMGLLFPTSTGNWQHTGSFHRDVFEPAALAAGWAYTDVEAPHGEGKTRLERQWSLTWHSLRHTFCTVAFEDWNLKASVVARFAGHDDPEFTQKRYVGAAEDSIEVALEATRAKNGRSEK